MSALPFEMRGGKGCPLCAPRTHISEFSYFVCTLAVSPIYLTRNPAHRGSCAVDLESAQRENSLNPRPLRIIGIHLSARASRVFTCFAPEI